MIELGEFRLQSAGWLDGRSAAVVVDDSAMPRPSEPDMTGPFSSSTTDGDESQTSDLAVRVRGGLGRHGAGRVRARRWIDLTEAFAYHDAAGGAVD